jgi:hypothetical protein
MGAVRPEIVSLEAARRVAVLRESMLAGLDGSTDEEVQLLGRLLDLSSAVPVGTAYTVLNQMLDTTLDDWLAHDDWVAREVP